MIEGYEELKKVAKRDLKSPETLAAIKRIYRYSNEFLNKQNTIQLSSKIENKEYIAKGKGKKMSRPLNTDLYRCGETFVEPFFDCLETNDYTALNSDQITSACYRIAISFCASIDLLKSGDKKTPGTFFEYFMGFMYANKLGIAPTKQLDVLNIDISDAKLPTDFIFDLGKHKPKFHVPVKTSTRERVIQVWAHQRVLDGVYGVGRFHGMLNCLAETKLAKVKMEVTEICLPVQWHVYQLFIAQLKRVYYLDMPKKYSELNNIYPKISVKPFGEFFGEIDAIGA